MSGERDLVENRPLGGRSKRRNAVSAGLTEITGLGWTGVLKLGKNEERKTGREQEILHLLVTLQVREFYKIPGSQRPFLWPCSFSGKAGEGLRIAMWV